MAAAAAIQNPPSKSASKSAKKKKTVRSDSFETSTQVGSALEVDTQNGAPESSNGDGGYESPYIKELYKNIRNINKKITNASRVDNILAENLGMALDELVTARKINADQKAQILKKPQLQASLTQLEEQIAQYKKFDQEYKARIQTEKAEAEQSFNERCSKEVDEKVSAAKDEAVSLALKEQKRSLLLISQFLQLAAVRRGDEEADPSLDENKALEGLLAKVYSGDESAVTTMLKIAQGFHETTVSVNGELLSTTYADVQAAAIALPRPSASALVEEVMEATELPVQSDPTLVNVVLTELAAPTVTTMANGHHDLSPEFKPPQNSEIGEGAAAVVEANWDHSHNDLSTSQEWVQVPRDTAETDTGIAATLAAPPNIQSWADDQPESEKPPAPPANSNDGFHEVQRSRGGKDRVEGQFRGRGRGGDGYRGRGGFRGDHRGGRGRGGAPRGARGGGGRRTDEP